MVVDLRKLSLLIRIYRQFDVIVSAPRRCCQIELPYWPLNGSTMATSGRFCREATISLIDSTVWANVRRAFSKMRVREHAKDSIDHQIAHLSIQRQLSLFVTGGPFFCSHRAKKGSRTSTDA